QLSGAINGFLAGLSITPEQDTRLVQIVYRHSNPQFTAQAANAIADVYAQENLRLRLENTQKLIDWVTNEVHKQEKILSDTEAAMQTYRETNNAQALGDKQNIVTQRLSTVNDALSKARAARVTIQTQYDQVKTADPAKDSADNF